MRYSVSLEHWRREGVNHLRELRGRLVRRSCQERRALLRHRVPRQARRQRDHQELRAPAEVVELARPDSLPAADFAQPAVAVVVAAAVDFQADFARMKLARRR